MVPDRLASCRRGHRGEAESVLFVSCKRGGCVMGANLSIVGGEAISRAAEIRRHRRTSAEPLWFALMCRHLWGTNAPKELQFIVGGSDRTCRAWASGDTIPQSDILVALILSNQGRAVLDYLMSEVPMLWWLALLRAERIAAQVDALDLK